MVAKPSNRKERGIKPCRSRIRVAGKDRKQRKHPVDANRCQSLG